MQPLSLLCCVLICYIATNFGTNAIPINNKNDMSEEENEFVKKFDVIMPEIGQTAELHRQKRGVCNNEICNIGCIALGHKSGTCDGDECKCSD